MSNKDFVEGVNIISKYLKNDDYDYFFGNERICFGQCDLITNEKDKKRLRKLGWEENEDEDGWDFFD